MSILDLFKLSIVKIIVDVLFPIVFIISFWYLIDRLTEIKNRLRDINDSLLERLKWIKKYLK